MHRCAIWGMDIQKQKLVTKIARLYYLGDQTQQEIADKLGISRTRVSRYLNLARSEKIVDIKIHSPSGQYETLELEIEKKFNLKECIIVPSYEDKAQILKAMAARLSSMLDRRAAAVKYLGIGWGTTLKSLTDYMEIKGSYPVKVIPLIGGLGKIGTGIHTNSIAATLAQRLGGISYIINAPAVVDNRQVKEFIEKDSNTEQIIRNYDKVEMAILGISDIGQKSTLLQSGNFKPEEFDYLKSLQVIGDINLIFIDRQGKPVKNRLNHRLIRASWDRLKQIQDVVVVGFGLRKAPVIKAALQGGIMDRLITDDYTARKVGKD